MASHKELKARQRRERHAHSPSVALRVHRALSWLGRAEKERADDDARFVFLWVAFNAAYATESHDPEMTVSFHGCEPVALQNHLLRRRVR
jgi:hypothetical protein